MATSLREALRETLSGWQTDLAPEWRKVLDGVQLAFDAVDARLELHPWEPIFPSRRHFPLPGAPAGAHLLRAFDSLKPDDVRCVLVGQDPYPNIAFFLKVTYAVNDSEATPRLQVLGRVHTFISSCGLSM